MEMTEKELKYMLHLLDGLTESLYDEIIQIYYDVAEKKIFGDFSDTFIAFFRENLKNNPVTTSTILSYFQKNLSTVDPKINAIQQLFINVLSDILNEATKTEHLISLISLIRFDEEFIPKFKDNVVTKISDDVFRQNRKQIFISLLSHQRPELLRTCSDYLKSKEASKEFKLTPEYMLELCYVEGQHWLLKAAQVYKQQLYDMKKVTFKINNFTKQILILVLIDIVNNQENYDFPSTVNQLKNIFSILNTYTSADKQLQFYITELKREFAIIKFCLENNCKLLSMGAFNQVLVQSALSVISQLCRLSRIDRYKVSQLLSANNDFLNKLRSLADVSDLDERNEPQSNWDIIVYNSYCAVTSVIDVVVNSDTAEDPQKLTSSLDEVKRLILSLRPIVYCIEIIENIYSCLFLRYEYFSCDEHGQDYPCGSYSDCSYFVSKKSAKGLKERRSSNVGFVCNSLTTQMILSTLKESLIVIEDQYLGEGRDSGLPENVQERLKEIVKMVNQSIWKLHLVSSLAPEAPAPQLKLSLDYADFGISSEDEVCEVEAKVAKKKTRLRKRANVVKSDTDQVMESSCMSSSVDGTSSLAAGNIEFTSLMLATPNCLVALALHHNDFTRANQIIEMFDLADAEIATEVVFTEKLRQLVAKIKNILFCDGEHRYPMKELSSYSVISAEVTSLVEGFLSSNRAPNSHEIVELARRHPHLQLYDHDKAPLINVIDILLSTGLKRETTYGLINIIERKLSEVQNNCEVTSKKTNYIHFIEELVGVMFEIFGSSEQSHSYVDNVCGVITDCRIPLKHKDFTKLNQHSKELAKCCEELDDIVNVKDGKVLDKNILQKYHQVYMNVVTIADKDICSISDSSHMGHKKSRIHYLRMCYIYAKNVAHLDSDNEKLLTDSAIENSYFSILDKHLHTLVGELIYEKNVPVSSLEPVCKKLSVNLIHKLILNFCPPISLGHHLEASEANFNNLLQLVYEFKNAEEKLFVERTADFAPLQRSPDPQCITYIVLHNWVLANIVKKIHTATTDLTLQQSIDSRTRFLNNFMDLERFEYLKILYGGNRYLASFHMNVDLDALFMFMPKLIESGKLLTCLHIIDALAEQQVLCSPNLMNLRDLVLFKLAIQPMVEYNWKFCEHLKCPEMKMNLVLNNLSSWTVEGAMEVLDYLKFLLHPVAKEDGIYDKCNDWMMRIPIYDQISCIISKDSWYEAYEMSIDRPEEIVEILLDSQQFKLCLEWADIHEVSTNVKNLIISSLLRQLFEYTDQATPAHVANLLARLPASHALDLIQEDIAKIRNLELLHVCVDFVTEHSTDWRQFENIKIGLVVMSEIDPKHRHMFWDVIERPLLMIEQFLMNAKLEKLTALIARIAPSLKVDPAGDNLYYNIKSIDSLIISRNAVDALLRFYAEKALDLKNPRSAPPPVRLPDVVLLQSIDSINLEASSGPFAMPEEVPPKEQWVGDYSTDRCMVCKIAIFSMIIRRHHCRRCGRLVCHACSRGRMQVPTYPTTVKLRVCDDCVKQSAVRAAAEPTVVASTSESQGSNVTGMDWCLTADARRNAAVRHEFTYEFTPNVTLCLTIMKMHSINLDYPRFLLDRSDEVAGEMAAGGDPRLLVRARRSLLLAAAELYSRAPPHRQEGGGGGGGGGRVAETGAEHALRCLAHADAMATLVRHACHHLLQPPRARHHLLPPQRALPGHFVRCLIEAERWEVALEVATKSGLARGGGGGSGVLAAWGKACLRAGCYRRARDLLARCLRRGAADPDFCEEAAEAISAVNRSVHKLRASDRSSSMVSLQSDGRPRVNPPLLDEIIGMLVGMNYPVNPQLLAKAESIQATNEKLASMKTSRNHNHSRKKIPLNEPALNIMHTLASVNKIKQGDFSDFHVPGNPPTKPKSQGLLRRSNSVTESKPPVYNKLDPFFYKECVYYLSNFGSHMSNIAFYMAHSSVAEALEYCYDNVVDKDVFTESVYMECLKRDRVNELLKCMLDVDSTLETWSEYITHTCRTLEATGRLDALYSLQCGTAQHARAAATCARLYARPLPRTDAPHRAVAARAPHLAAAAHHLVQCVPSDGKHNPKSFHLHLDKATLEKHMTTISRQMELAKYLEKCEESKRLTEKMMQDVMPMPSTTGSNKDYRPLTLFGSNSDKAKLAAIVLVAGSTVQDGFSLAYRIITDGRLDSLKVYSAAARHLVQSDRFAEVRDLAASIRTSGETGANPMSDQTLQAGVQAVVARCSASGQLFDEMAELLIQDVHSVGIKISCYLECRIVSSAYILAVRHDRTNDLRRVLREAERLGQDQVRRACLKRLSSEN